MGQAKRVAAYSLARSKWVFFFALWVLGGCSLDPLGVATESVVDPRCPPGMPTLVGTSGPDTLTGSNGAECILGLGGDDILYGNGGADVVIGGEGADTLHGGNQTDTLYGDEGNDTLRGGNQDDTLHGGNGDDNLFGDNGRDELRGNDGADYLEGGNGKDTLYGGADCDVLDGRNGSESLYGEAGDDVIHGGHAPERIEGGEGNDVIEGGSAPAVISGGAGFDRCIGADCEAPAPASCTSSSTCAGGSCDTRVELCVPSGFCPPSIDAGTPDAGVLDAFSMDAPSFDTPAMDTPSFDTPTIPDAFEPPDTFEAPDAHQPPDAHAAPDAFCASTTDASCDGFDDDCDGNVDEDYASVATTCGVGACSATGATSCVAGAVTDSCTPGAPAANDATCNAIDDDCDGSQDEDYASVATTCGIGACGATGATSCVAGAVTDSCTPGAPAASDATCNATDDDCDGSQDEDYASVATTCGIGACGATGATSCVAGAVTDSCTPGAPAANDATCNAIDDDCDGSQDEDYASLATTCGIGACGATGATSCVAGTVTDSCTPGAPAANDATCNATDDDCDGSQDEDYASTPTTCGIGACGATGATSCVAGTVTDSCTPGAPAASDATCNATDDDCDGSQDEDYAVTATSCGLGVCQASGSLTCVAGAEVDSCAPGAPTSPLDSTCNGLDDDCDGPADEEYVSVDTTCGVGACGAMGATSCVAGAVTDSCTPGAPAASDATCNAVDDDCDGSQDEDYAVTATSCGLGVCQASGSLTCVAGAEVDSCAPGAPTSPLDSTCNGLDDDCDGPADEEYVSVDTTCGVGACGATGATSCVAGAVTDSCTPGAPAASDGTCNAVDDDCDGSQDEDYAVTATSCGLGVCQASGSLTCVAGAEVDSCAPGAPTSPLDSTCNGLDDDCDGPADEEYVSVDTTCGIGACGATGATSCVAGAVTDSCTPGAPAANDATCNAIDDDCDGSQDEDYAVTATSCGLGVCQASGSLTCVAGAEVDSCAPGAPTSPLDSTCNGLDDDCDGPADEEYLSVDTTCGIGACGATGATSCVAGAVTDSCTPGAPAASDATCNAIDDDCDGSQDEDYASVATTCGIGACGATGATSCVAGTVTDSCTPGAPAANDATCNAIDDDCDGSQDEDYASVATTCGIGACGATGATSCVAGTLVDSCMPGAPAVNDATCNAVDDDCDGSQDEDYALVPTTCGIGACAAIGAFACVAGTVVDTCAPGAPAPSDATCNGVDDDCDGPADEEYVSIATTCGVGGCASTGVTTCLAGAVIDTCAPWPPAGSDETCNAVDDDCDSATDEDYVASCAGTQTVTCTAEGEIWTECNDNDVCTGAESCLDGACQPGTALDTDDGNPCTADSCDPVFGAQHADVADGTSCSNSDACDGLETCQTGSCTAGPLLVVDDGNPCTADACHPLSGVSHTVLPFGTSCDDGDPCNGVEVCTALGICLAGPRPLEGACVPPGPSADIFLDEERELLRAVEGASVVSYTGSTAPTLFNDLLGWSSDIEPGGAELIVDLGGDLSVVDHVSMRGTGVRHFEIAASRTGTNESDFTTILATEAPWDVLSHDYVTERVTARYLRITLFDHWNGDVGRGAFDELTAYTRPRDGGALHVFESGRAPITAPSDVAQARYATDWDPSTFYSTATWAPGHTFEIDLPGVTQHVVDRVRLQGRNDWNTLRDFEVWVSSTGTNPADFSQVLVGELPADDEEHWYFFPPVTARYVQLRAVTNHGGPLLNVYDFQTFTMIRGGLVAPFESRSIAGGTPIVFWRWEFGDGDVSFEEHPTHEYAAPGEYLVRIEVIDEYGLWAQTELLYSAEAPPTADVAFSPALIHESETITFLDTSVPSSASQPLVATIWDIDGPGAAFLPSAHPPGDTVTHLPEDSRPVTVRLVTIDSSLLRDEVVRVVGVENLVPEVDIADDQTLFWGERWVPREEFGLTGPPVILRDPSLVESNSLVCDYDFDDGTVVTGLACRANDFDSYYVDHAWAVPGTYDVVLAGTDLDGARTEDHVSIEVVRRPTGIVIDSVPTFAAGGVQTVTVHVVDLFDGGLVEARAIEARFGTATATGVTDATGTASVELDLGTGAPGVIEASFAGDTLYLPSDGSRVQPEGPVGEARGTCGREFLLTTLRRCDGSNCNREVSMFRDELVLSADVETVAQLSIASLGFSRAVRVPAHGTIVVLLPRALEHHEPGVLDQLVLEVSSSAAVCATVLSYEPFTTDSYLGLPTSELGTEYAIHHTGELGGVGDWAEVIVVGTTDATTVTITPPAAITMLPDGITPGLPLTFTLGRGEAYYVRNALNLEDLSGAHIVSDAPIAVFAGHNCTNIPPGAAACDTNVEQIPPAHVLGTHYAVPPLGGRASGYVAEISTVTEDTDVFIDGVLVATLDPTEVHRIDEPTQTAHVITSSAPVLVTQYAKGLGTDGVGDPFQMTIIPSDRFGRDYGFTTVPDYYDPVLRQRIEFFHHTTLVTTALDTGAVRLDGAPVLGWVPVPGSDLAYADVPIDAGDHRVSTLAPGATVGAYAYGWQTFESYGHPGYYRLTPRTACAPTATIPGNGEDDDCDGLIDEEDANGLDDDGDGLTDEDVRHEVVPLANVAPIAQPGRIGLREDGIVSFVLSAFDANGDPLTFEVLSLPTHGVLTGTAPSLTYEPDADFHGEDTLTFRVCDLLVCSAPATFTLAVASQGDPPDIDMVPFLNATTNGLLTLPCVANHIDDVPGCAITWTLVDGPPGMSIDPVTADIYWVPGPDFMNTAVSVTVRATDCRGLSSVFTFGVAVGTVTSRPIITSRPITDAVVGALYQYDVEAIDLDPGQTISGFHLDPLFTPAGLSIDEPSGLISWTPGALQAGEHEVRVWAEDSVGTLSLPQVFTITVGGDTTAPSVELVAEPLRILAGESSEIAITVVDDLPGAVIESATIFGPGYPPTGAALALTPALPTDAATATFVAATSGVYPIVAVGLDTSGNRTTRTTAIRVLVPGDDTPPAVELTAPVADAELTYFHDAIGSVSDANLHSWTLAVRRHDRQARAEGFAGEEPYRTLAEGTENVSGTLAQIDTTQLENGLYVLRLRGEDVNGQVGEDTVVVRVEGGAKVGVVQLSFVDLVTEDFGIPLAIVRSYDSRRAYRVGDFGHGWELEMRMGSVQSNIPTGLGYAISTQPEDFTPCTRVQEQQYHFTEVRLSDDEWYVFHPEPVNIQTIAGGCAGEIAFEQTDGSRPGATLTPTTSTSFRATSLPVSRFGAWAYESNFVADDTGEPLRIESFVLTTRDGRTFWINTRDGITDIQDRNGNSLSIRQGSIASSSGRGMEIVRDARGRITQVLGGDGRSVGYGYDGAGNLVSFLDPAERTTRFEYRNAAHPHHLTDIIDWRGVRVAAIDYQPDGRLGRMCDADGVCQRSSYDLGARQMTITDGLGIPNRYTWDQRGNVTGVLDGLGNLTEYTYGLSCLDDVVGITDQLGHTTNTFRDPATCDVIARVEPHLPTENAADFTTSYQYDAAGRVTAEVLPTGGITFHDRDAAGNETATRDDSGNVVFSRTYGGHGELLTETSRFGTLTYEYGPGPDGIASSRPTRVTDTRGRVTDFTYDGQGNVLSAERGALRVAHRYDSLGRRIFSDYGRGVNVSFGYGEVVNEWTSATVSTRGTYTRRFTSSGRLVEWSMPNGDTGSRVYDALGRVRRETDALGNETITEYDHAGRVESVEDVARGATTTYVRDAVGRTLSETDPLGHITSRTYDVRGAMLTMTNAVGRTWTYSTTPQQSVSSTPLGNTTTSTRTSYGLPGTTTLPGGATTGSTFDGNTQADESSRFPLTRTDESGRTRDFAYDALGGLDSVTDLSGAAWDYDYTTVAASDLEVSVEGGTVSLVASEGESDVYRFGGGPSAAGEEARVPTEDLDVWQEALESVTSPEGSETRYEYDAGGHRRRIVLPNGHEELRTWTSGHLDLVTLPFGTTLDYTRDSAFRVTGRTGTDGSSLAFTYGPQDRIATATDETGTVTHEYDAVGRQTGIVHPTGARVGRSYDAIDQTRHITVRGSATGTVRDTEYVYDDANRLSEVHDPLGGITTYAYDDDSRLTSRTLPNGVTTTWTYNARGWVMSVTHRRADTSVIASRTYERSPSGEPTRITNHDGSYVLITYDDALRVQSEAYRDAGGGVLDNIEYTYDLDGNRTTRRRGATIATSTLEEYTYAPGDELTTVSVGGTATQTWTHDDAGRTTSITRGGHEQEIAYDADDHITSIIDGSAETRWEFDAEGRRTRREDLSGGVTDSAHRYVQGPTTDASLDSAHMVTTDAGAEELAYVFAPIPGGAEHPLFRYDPTTGESVYYLQDSMGSVIGLVDQTTTQTATFEYDGFGGERSATGTLASLPVASRGDYRFHGMWLDSSVGLYYVRARVYDASVGRFLSNDPAEGRTVQPETFESTRFVHGNAYRFDDSTGRFTLGAQMTTVAIAASLAAALTYTAATIGWYLQVSRANSALYIEGGLSSGSNPSGLTIGAFHRSIGVGQPGREAWTLSYSSAQSQSIELSDGRSSEECGLLQLVGETYSDRQPGGALLVDRYIELAPDEVEVIRVDLERMNQAPFYYGCYYPLSGIIGDEPYNCRTYVEHVWDEIIRRHDLGSRPVRERPVPFF
jgi:RHS repeat-associated protein